VIRTDHVGFTSIIRDLGLNGAYYHNMLHFFRADSWNLHSLIAKWTKNDAVKLDISITVPEPAAKSTVTSILLPVLGGMEH